jgi:prepilin peptidase CpaA
MNSHHIPNLLVLAGAGLGILTNTAFSAGLGLASAAAGMATGLALLLPFYLLRAMGAADVKLMAMTGAFLGPWDTLGAVLGTFLAGGALSLLFVLKAKAAGRMFRNLKDMAIGSYFRVVLGKPPVLDAPLISVGKLPYGVAIALGTSGFVILHGFGVFYWSFS